MTHIVFARAEIDPAKLLPPEIRERSTSVFEQPVLELKVGCIEIAASTEQLQLIADKINEFNKRKGVA